MMGMERNGLSLSCTIFISSMPSTSGIMMSVKMRSTSCVGDDNASIACLPFIAVVTVSFRVREVGIVKWVSVRRARSRREPKKKKRRSTVRRGNTRANSPNESAPVARAGVALDASGRVGGTYLGVHSSSAGS